MNNARMIRYGRICFCVSITIRFPSLLRRGGALTRLQMTMGVRPMLRRGRVQRLLRSTAVSPFKARMLPANAAMK
jgi:hypothetical protein